MKIIDVIALLILLLLLLPVKLYSQSMSDNINSALKTGNSKELGKYFNANIYLVLPTLEGVYTKTQSTLLLHDFFVQHIPNNYILMQESGKDASKCVIGTLYTSKGNYRVVFLRKNAGGKFIDQFRIEDEN
jgi:hypothetical protein